MQHGTMWRISKLIAMLQETLDKFGDTCVWSRELKWGSVAMWAETDEKNRPEIVCLCGSTKFWETFRDWGLKLTLAGKIVLTIGVCAPDSMVLANPDTEEGKQQKEKLDDLHKRKIDLADRVMILNVDGYIGRSTRSELEYAERQGKPIDYFEQPEPERED